MDELHYCRDYDLDLRIIWAFLEHLTQIFQHIVFDKPFLEASLFRQYIIKAPETILLNLHASHHPSPPPQKFLDPEPRQHLPIPLLAETLAKIHEASICSGLSSYSGSISSAIFFIRSMLLAISSILVAMRVSQRREVRLLRLPEFRNQSMVCQRKLLGWGAWLYSRNLWRRQERIS